MGLAAAAAVREFVVVDATGFSKDLVAAETQLLTVAYLHVELVSLHAVKNCAVVVMNSVAAAAAAVPASLCSW